MTGCTLLSGFTFLVGCGNATTTESGNIELSDSITPAKNVSDIENTTAPSDSDIVATEWNGDFDDIFNHEIVSETEAAPAYITISGHEFKINSSAYCTYFENVGPAIVVGDQMQYRIKIQDKSYEEVKSGDMTAKAVAAGATITEGPALAHSSDTEYMYFAYTISGDKCVGFSMPGPDPAHAIGIQIALTDNSVSTQDAINTAMLVAKTATLTDNPDSTKEDIDKKYHNMNSAYGKRVDKATISYKGASLSFTVPEGFNQTLDQTDDFSSMQFYRSGDTSITLSLRSISTPGTASHFLENTLMWIASEDVIKSIATSSTENGEIAYAAYYSEPYESYYINCAMVIDDEYILTLEAENESRSLSLNEVIGFFDCKPKEETEEIVLGPVTSIKCDQLFQGKVESDTRARELIAQYGEIQRSKYNNPEITKIEKNLQTKYDICAVNLGELDIDTAKDIERGVSYMFDKYPILKGSLNTLSLINMSGSSTTLVALTQTENFVVVSETQEFPKVVRNEIVLNANKWLNRDNMLEMCKNNVESGYWFNNANDPSKVIVHELSHQLLNVIRAKEYDFYEEINGSKVYIPCLLTEQNKEAYLNYFWSGTAMNQEVEKALLKEAYESWKSLGNSGSEEDFRCSISQYANGIKSDGGISYHETFAEAIADIYCNGDNASAASKCIAELAEKKLNE